MDTAYRAAAERKEGVTGIQIRTIHLEEPLVTVALVKTNNSQDTSGAEAGWVHGSSKWPEVVDDPAADPGEALGQEEPDREEGLWRPGLPAAEYPEDLEGPGCNPGQREPNTEGELELPAVEYLDELEGPERPA
ncbi:unnamed protein product [Caretta caretta]